MREGFRGHGPDMRGELLRERLHTMGHGCGRRLRHEMSEFNRRDRMKGKMEQHGFGRGEGRGPQEHGEYGRGERRGLGRVPGFGGFGGRGRGFERGPWRPDMHGRGPGRGEGRGPQERGEFGRGEGRGRGRGPGFERGPGRRPDWSEMPDEHRGHGRGHGRGGPFGGGPFGGRERLQRGMMRYIMLDALRDGPKHGYEIIRQLEERTNGRYSPSPGTLYPTLQYLEDLNNVTSTQDEGRRVYELTDAGRAELEAQAAVVEAFWSNFRDQTSQASRHELKFLGETLDSLYRTVKGGLQEAAASGDQETIRKTRQVLERAQNEIREIIAGTADADDVVTQEDAEHE